MKKLFVICVVLIFGSYSGYSQGFWTQKSNVGTGSIGYASSASFTVGNKGYLCCGIISTDVNVLLEYDASMNTWTQKSNFPGPARRDANAFTIGNKAYVGIGFNYNGSYNFYTDFYEYNPATNSWTTKAVFPGLGRSGAFAFSINGMGYFGGGSSGSGLLNDLWQYDPVGNTWTQKNNLPFTLASGVAFAVGNYGYAGVGSKTGSTYSTDFWQYNSISDSWTQKANFGGNARFEATAYTMYKYGYVGTGNNASTFFYDFWQYDVDANTWTQVADLPGSARRECISFSINNKGYVGTGYDGTTWDYLKDVWEYTPTWFGMESNSPISQSVEIYPNPATRVIVINDFKNNTIASVFDLNGQVIFTKQLTTPELDISSLANGLYFLKLTSTEGIVVRKFVKE